MPKDRTRRRFLASDVQLVVERSSKHPVEYAIVLLVLRDSRWRNLIEGQATVLVGEDTELLLVPLRRGVIDRLTGRVPVSVAPRTHGHASSYATLSRLGRHPVRQMRALAHA